MGVQPSVRQIGKYVVVDVIGAGGMGIVYRANDPAIGRTVAIKMLKQSDAANPSGLLERFFSREMRSTASLNHKNIVTVYDSGDQDGNPYLVMEYLEGDPTSKIISERMPLSLVEKLDLVIQVCDGLQYAHDREIVHRDIKPANVIRLSDGIVKIVDFGVSRVAGTETTLVQTGHLVGSLSYMSPEQINQMPIDGRSDIFSAGVMLYELLTYALPFKAADPGATFVKILREDPAPLSNYIKDLPAAMQGVLNRALAKKAGDRYQSAEEFGFDLLHVQKELKDITILDCMKRADAALNRGDLERARTHLQEIIKLDRQHERANRLLRDVRQRIQQLQRSSQVIQMRSQAQVALAGMQYEEALACADQALRLDPADQESIHLCDEIRIAISRAKAVREALNRAETATFAGDFDEAKEAIEESLRLAPNDSEARALALLVNKELAERSRRLQVQEFVDSARRGIAERKFIDAIDALHRAEELDPADSNVRELLQWAERGQEQEKRRRDLEEITEQIDKALHAGDYTSAYTISDVGLLRFPDEPTLMRLRAISEKQRDIVERRSFVHDQSLAVKVLCEEQNFAEAVNILTGALQKYPGEPNLESLLALTRSEIERHEQLRAESLRQEAIQRAEAEARAAYRQQILSWAVELRTALDAHAELDSILASSAPLRDALHANQVEDEHGQQVAGLVLQEIDARISVRDQVMRELHQLRQIIADPQNALSIAEADSRLLSIKSTYPQEKPVQQVCDELIEALRNLRRQRDETILALTSIAQDLARTPTSKLPGLFQSARELAGSMAAEPRVGALLQQIESGVTRRLQQREERMRDLGALSGDLLQARSLADLSRVRERGRAIAALDSSDDGLAARFQEFDAEARRRQGELLGVLNQLQVLAGKASQAATVAEAEEFASQVTALGATHPDFQDLQEAVTRTSAEVQGRRMEHDLIVQELQSLRASILTFSSPEELVVLQTRTTECRASHAVDPEVSKLCDEIESDLARVLRDIEENEQRRVACNRVIETAGELLRDRRPVEALSLLLDSEPRNPDREDLRHQISVAREMANQLQVERERAEAARVRKAAIAQEIATADRLRVSGSIHESLQSLREASLQYSDSQELSSAIEFVEVEIARQKAEQERAEKARIEQERAEKARIEQELAEKARIEQERAEKARIEQERAEKVRIEQERAEKVRIEQERAEKARIEQELAEKARIEQELAEKARIEQELAEKARIEQERAEKARIELERAEKARIEQERAEKARIEQERAEKARIEQERAEKARIEQERAEKVRIEQERAEKVRIEQERAEKARIEQERAEKARIEQERAEKARIEQERAEKARIEQERAEKARIEQELAEKARIEQERAEKARIEQERAEKARVEQERTEKARIEQERAEKARIEQERAEKARIEQERAEKVRIEQERAERVRIEQERAEKARIEQERAEKARIEQERTEKARIEQERAEKARIEQERAEKARIEQERAEKVRIEQERAEKARIEQERAEKARIEQERAEKARIEQERAEKVRIEQERAEKARIKRESEKARIERAAKARAEQVQSKQLRVEQAEAEKLRTTQAREAERQAKLIATPRAATSPLKIASTARKPAMIVLALVIGFVLLAIVLVKKLTSHPQNVARPNEVATPAPAAPGPASPAPAQPGPGGSLAILTTVLPRAVVSLDGHPQGDLSSHRVDLSALAPGSHVVTIKENNKELNLQLQVTDQGSLEVTTAHGMDEQMVLAVTRSGGQQTVFCRCAGAEIRLDGKLLRPGGRDRYQVKDSKRSAQEITLTLRGEKQQIRFNQADTSHGLLFIENASSLSANEKQPVESAQASLPVTPPAAAQPQVTPQALPAAPNPPPSTSPAQPAKAEDPAMAAWAGVQGTTDVSALRNFRDKFPNSPMAKVAAVRMESLSWDSVKNSTQPADYARFLKDYPDSPHAQETKSKLASLTKGIEDTNQQQRLQQDQKEVLQALDAYKSAYEAKDVDRLAAAWPGAPTQKLQDTFKVIGRLHMTLAPEAPNVVGDTATVRATQKLEIQSQGSTSSNRTAIVFIMKRVQGKWVIDSLK